MLKKIFTIITIIFFSLSFSNFIFAGNIGDSNYQKKNSIFLENLPGLENLESETKTAFKEGGNTAKPLRMYINWIIKTSVILGSMLAVALIIYGGIKYMTSVAFTGKTEGKEYLTNALGGLIFLIGGYIIFIQINPNILKLNFNAAAAAINIEVSDQYLNMGEAEEPDLSSVNAGDITEGSVTFNPSSIKPTLQEVLAVAEINTPLRFAHFMAQSDHESAGFTLLTERYHSCTSAKRTWPKRISQINNVCSNCSGKIDCGRKIFNAVYGNRMGNGSPSTGDGNKYRGRGILQATGKSEYSYITRQYSKYFHTSKDFIKNPDLLGQPEDGIRSGVLIWIQKGGNAKADRGATRSAVEAVTKAINGGQNGIENRWKLFQKYCKEVNCN